MKYFFILFSLFISVSLFAKSNKFSTISIPQGNFINLETEYCSEFCANGLLENKQIFSFLARYDDKNSTKQMQEKYLIYGQFFNIFLADIDTHYIRLAVLVPQKTIKRYALTSVNTITSYLLKQSNEFELVVFNSEDEKEESILNALNSIRKSGFSHVVAPITKDGASILIENSDGIYVYIPTLHKSLFKHAPSNIFFGGIDYISQVNELEKFTNDFVMTISDGGELGSSIDAMIATQDKIFLSNTTFKTNSNNFKKFFENNDYINSTSIYINTPLVTTSLIASQIRLYKHEPYGLYTTQINYNPMLLTLTQEEDRERLFLANSIGNIDFELDSINAILGHELEYDWVNYSTSIGAEYLMKRFFNSKAHKLFLENIEDGQVEYKTNIIRAGSHKFYTQDEYAPIEAARIEKRAKEKAQKEEDLLKQQNTN